MTEQKSGWLSSFWGVFSGRGTAEGLQRHMEHRALTRLGTIRTALTTHHPLLARGPEVLLEDCSGRELCQIWIRLSKAERDRFFQGDDIAGEQLKVRLIKSLHKLADEEPALRKPRLLAQELEAHRWSPS